MTQITESSPYIKAHFSRYHRQVLRFEFKNGDHLIKFLLNPIRVREYLTANKFVKANYFITGLVAIFIMGTVMIYGSIFVVQLITLPQFDDFQLALPFMILLTIGGIYQFPFTIAAQVWMIKNRKRRIKK